MAINRRLFLCFFPAHSGSSARHASAGRACTFHSKPIFSRRPRRRLTLRCGARSPLRLTVLLLVQLSISFMACNLHPSSLPPAHLRSVCIHAQAHCAMCLFPGTPPPLTSLRDKKGRGAALEEKNGGALAPPPHDDIQRRGAAEGWSVVAGKD